MAEGGSAYKLNVAIEVQDKFSSSLKSLGKMLEYSKAQADLVSKSMRAMGSTGVQIDSLTSKLNKLARANQIQKLAQDMHAAGASNAEIQTMAKGIEQVAAAQEKLQKYQKVAVTGGVMMGLGAAGVDMLTKAVNMAGQFQSQLVTIQDVTGATNKQMQALGNTIMNTSAQVSRFSDMQVAGFAQQLASGGVGGIASVQKLLPAVSKFADAQMYEGKASDATESVNMAINMAHLLGHYAPTSLLKSLNTFNKYSVMEPGSSQDLYQTLKYLVPKGRSLHMDETSMMQMAALANRVGLTGSHGGTNAADLIYRLIPGAVLGMNGKPSPSVMAAMKQLGMVNSQGQSQFFKNGQITNFTKMVQTLVNDTKKLNPEQRTVAYQRIFGTYGSNAASLFSDPKVLQQLQGMVKQTKQTKSVDQIYADQLNTPAGQMNQLKSNSMTAIIRFSQQLGQVMMPVLKGMNSLLGTFIKFEANNPRLVKFAAVAATAATGLLVLGGAITSFAGLIGMATSSWAAGGAARVGLSAMGKLAASPVTLPMKAYDKVAPAIGRGAWYAGQTVKNGAQWLGSASLNGIKSAGTTIASTTKSLASMATQAALAGTKMAVLAVRTGAVKVAQMAAAGAAKLFRLAMIGVNLVLDANPIAILVLAIAALIAIVIVMITHWKQTVQIAQMVWDKFKQFASWIGTAFMNIVHQAADWGKNIILGLWNGISGMAGWISSKISNFVSEHISGPIKRFLGIHSPSRLMMQYGQYTVQGFAMGMTNNTHLVENASNQMANSAVPNVSGIMSSRGSGAGIVINGLTIQASSADGGRAAAKAFQNELGRSIKVHNMGNSIYSNKLL